ncbi:MAG TPA: hypothetical protein VKR61_00100 [Bryobacteraceae bacterium]|nr:hypothetical protein [Bryobacteraceae bacterium]
MRFPTLLILTAAAAVLTGCAPAVSIHPLYTSRELIADPALVGTWADPEGDIWQVQKSGDGYDVTVLPTSGTPSTGPYNVHLLRLKDQEFVDVTAKSDSGLAIAAHMFAKVSLQGDELLVALLDDDWLKKTVASGAAPSSVSGESGGQIVLTAPTADLQRFITRHAVNPDAWDPGVSRLHRVH